MPPNCIVIHHSVTPGDYPIERIAEYHVSRGYHGIAYHYIVAGTGAVYRTNDDMLFTWHGNAGGNSGIGIALLGDFTNAPPPEPQLRAVRELVTLLMARWNITKVIGHREALGASTACPGHAFTDAMVHALAEEAPMTTTKLAGHWQDPYPDSAAWLASALPPALKVLGNVGPSDVAALFEAYQVAGRPRPLVLNREWTDDKRDEWVMAGATGAQPFYERTIRRYAQWRHITDVVLGINEFIPWGPDEMRRLSEFDAAAAALFHRDGFRYMGGNFSVGWPQLEHWQYYAEALAAIDYLGLHEYWWPTLPADGWRALRYRRAMATIRGLGLRLPPIVIGEVGWDEALLDRPHRGFQGASQAAYLDWLRWYDAEIAKDSEVVCAAVFETGAAGDWRAMGFDVVGSEIAGALASYIRAGAAEAPASGGQGESDMAEQMEILAYTATGQPTTVEALRAQYGFAVRRAAEVAPGAEVFRLVALREKTGPATLVVKTTRDGVADVGRRVAFAWPDAPAQPNTGHDWLNRYVTGETNENGDVGFGLGSGAYIQDIATGGPHAVWVWSPSAPSDALFGIGMLGGTVHDHVEPEFALVKEPAVVPAPPTPPAPPAPPQPEPLTEAIRNRCWNAIAAQVPVPYNPSAAFAQAARAMRLGAPLTGELDVDGHRCQGYALGIVYARIGDWGNVKELAW